MSIDLLNYEARKDRKCDPFAGYCGEAKLAPCVVPMASGTSKSTPSGEARLIPLGSHANAAAIVIKRPATLIGSRKDIVRLHLESSTVSKAHCVIVLNDWGCYIHDLGSRTHTRVNDKPVTDVDLHDGDTIQIGRFEFRYEGPDRPARARRAPKGEIDVSTLTDALPLTKRVIQIGRRRGSDLEFDDDRVSNIHAIIFERNGRRYIRDVGSRSGTWLDGKPVHQEPLRDGSVLKIGSATITLNEITAPTDDLPYVAPVPIPLPVPQIDKAIETGDESDAIPLALDAEIAPFIESEEAEAEEKAESVSGLDLTTEIEAKTEIKADRDSTPLDDAAIADLLAEPSAAAIAPDAPVEVPSEGRIELFVDETPKIEVEATPEPEPEPEIEVEAVAEPLPIVDEAETPEVVETVETTVESTDDESDDALAALRRGWHGAARIESEPEPQAEVEPEPVVEAEVKPESQPEPLPEIVIDEVPDAEPVVAINAAEALDESDAPVVMPIDDVTDDDGAIDLSDAPALPVAGAIAEPDLALEPDAAGLTDTPAIEQPAIEETPIEQPVVEEKLEEIAEAVIEEPQIDAVELASSDLSTPADRDTLLAELDLLDEPSTPPAIEAKPAPETPVVEAPASLSSAIAPEPVAELSAIDFSDLSLDDESADTSDEDASSDDTAFAVSEIDPFDIDEGESAEPLINLGDTIDGNEEDDISDTRPVAEPDIVEEALSLDDDQDDENTIAPPASGDLRDLIPSGGPLMGGAFSPPQGFMVGGSPLVDPPQDKPASAEAKPPEKPGEGAPARRKPLRVGFNTASGTRSGRSPFANESKPIADALMGSGESVDVFASPTPLDERLLDDPEKPAADGAKPAPVADDLAPPAAESSPKRLRPRGKIAAISGVPQAVVPNVPTPEEASQHARVRKSRLRRILWLMLLLVPLVGGVVFAIYKYMPVYSQLVATISFDGLRTASDARARNLKSVQNDYLRDEATRTFALAELGPAWQGKLGFLSDTRTINDTISKAPSERWPTDRPDQMHLVMLSRDKQDDMVRLKALASGLIKANEREARRATELASKADDAEAEIRTLNVRLRAVEQDLEVLRQLGNNRPDDTKLAEVETRRVTAEQALKSARTKRLDVESSIDLLAKQAPTELAPLPVADLSEADEDLKKLTTQLTDLQKQSDAARAALANKNDAARKALDAVINEFEAELKDAKKLKDSPELEAYVEAANRIFTQTRKLTDDLIARQEQQHTRLTELKQRLSDRILAQSREQLEKDGVLVDMKKELSMLERQKNASIAEGMKEEADSIELKMRLLKIKVDEAEYKHLNDPVQIEIITSLQGLIDQTAKLIQEDRKHIDATLTKAQDDFAKSAPAVEKLPAEQKALAESIEKRLAAVAEARKGYTQTSDIAEAEQAKLEAESKKKMATLQTEIRNRQVVIAAAAREQQAITAEENRKKRLAEKQLELASAKELEQTSQASLDAVTIEKEKMQEHRRRLIETDRDMAIKLADKSTIEAQMRDLRSTIATAQSSLADIIVPSSKFDVMVIDGDDKRPVYAGIGAGAIFVLMMIPIFINLRMISRESHHPGMPATADHESHTTNGFDPVFPESVDGLEFDEQYADEHEEVAEADESRPETVASR